MKTLRIALAQMNGTVGDLRLNAEKILEFGKRAGTAAADLVIFPEMSVSGYPPEDLVLKAHFVEDCMDAAKRIAAGLPGDMTVILGSPVRDATGTHNAALICHRGIIAGIYHKIELPNYGVFDEKRLFTPGLQPGCIRMGEGGNAIRAAVQICEDSWMPDSPALHRLAAAMPHLILNGSASPYHAGKLGERERILAASARTVGAPLVYCNLVGGQDELVFDGGSMVVMPDGRVAARAKRFEEDLLIVDLPLAERPSSDEPGEVQMWSVPAPRRAASDSIAMRIEPPGDTNEEIYAALRLGLRDYMEKNGFRKAVVALSGGIDSALVAAIAVDALGADRVAGVTMPSRFSSAETRGDAQLLADSLGIEFFSVPIQHLFESTLAELEPVWAGRAPDLTEENIQARLRGLLIMAMSNKFGWLVLSTGNKSELATGYCTLYGDMVGGFALIKDVFKTRVFELCRWRNAQGDRPVIPVSIIERPPSAELRDNQKDSDSLPPYEILDPILFRAVEQDRSMEQILADGFDPDTVRRVLRLIALAEYKRRQGAPGVKITPRAFGRDRRVPITHHYRERA